MHANAPYLSMFMIKFFDGREREREQEKKREGREEPEHSTWFDGPIPLHDWNKVHQYQRVASTRQKITTSTQIGGHVQLQE